MTTPTGLFVWRELLTTDIHRARAFYTQLFGWSVREAPMGNPEPYTLFHHDALDLDTAGAMTHPAPGVPSHWMDYITVADLEATLAQAVALGGKLLGEVIEVPMVGRMTWLQDPSGGVFAVLAPAGEGGPQQARPPVGTFCWSQLNTTDLDGAVAFYTALFGWTAQPMGPGMVVLQAGELPRCSVMQQPPGAAAPSHWLDYVAVDNADASFQQAVALGAQAFVPPTDMPGMGRFAVLADPTGALFALWRDANG